MSVINTNITSMIGQSNLNKSQNALQTSMERLSSGLRINSAKDDAAGQAIANRMTSQITGLAQAQRNANDGISAAQTAEGALNQINDNLQRVRELSVQAQNGTNSSSDLESIQNEITQRLSEIDRISEETTFNGTQVLAKDESLKIQVGANDGETITVGLKEINSSSMGVGSFDVTKMLSSANIGTDAVTTIGLDSPFETSFTPNIQANADQDINVSIQANSVDLSSSAQSSGITGVTVHQSDATSGFSVLASDGNYYDLQENGLGEFFFDSAAGVSSANIGDEATVSYVNATEAAVTTDLENITVGTDSDFFGGKTIYRRNDVTDAETLANGSGYAIQDNEGNYWALDLAASDTNTDGTNDTATFTITGGSGSPSNWVQVAASNITGATTDFIVDSDTPPAVTDDLYNIAVNPGSAPTADGLYALNDGSGNYAVLGSDSNYYAATVDTDTGEVTWNSSTGALNSDTVDTGTEITSFFEAPTSDGLYALEAGGYVVKGNDGNYYAATVDNDTEEVTWDSSTGAITTGVDESEAVTSIVTSSVSNAVVTGLADGETLHELKDSDGNLTGYIVKGEDEHGNVTHHAATIEVNSENEAVITKGEAKTVDALATLDGALNKIDELRSDLGAVQNRFEDAITNLSTNETNLAAARSRIEDADYAVEVANMTRAQILQQAGTSVLAQANQIPQNVLSLLG